MNVHSAKFHAEIFIAHTQIRKNMSKMPEFSKKLPKKSLSEKQEIANLRKKVRKLQKENKKLRQKLKSANGAFLKGIDEIKKTVAEESLETILRRINLGMRDSNRDN